MLVHRFCPKCSLRSVAKVPACTIGIESRLHARPAPRRSHSPRNGNKLLWPSLIPPCPILYEGGPWLSNPLLNPQPSHQGFAPPSSYTSSRQLFTDTFSPKSFLFKMAFGKDMDAWANDTGLALVEKNEKKSRFAVSWAEAKLLTIAGVGFLMDAWDLFIINIIYSIILLAYYKPKGKPAAKNIDWGLEGGVLKASANMGNIIGQIFFGFCGDMFGRSAVYGKELVIVIVAVILQISAPTRLAARVSPSGSPASVFSWVLVSAVTTPCLPPSFRTIAPQEPWFPPRLDLLQPRLG